MKQPRSRRGCLLAGDAGIEPDAREAQSAYQAVASTMLTSSMSVGIWEAETGSSREHRFFATKINHIGPVHDIAQDLIKQAEHLAVVRSVPVGGRHPVGTQHMVSFSNFRMLNPEMADITRQLLDDAYQRQSPFMSFMHTWMAFNGWMESVTGGGPDAAMIDALVGDRRLIEAYDRLIGDTPDFTKAVAALSTHWPVLSVKDVRKKLGHDAFWRMTRQNLLEDCRAGGVRMQPGGWIGDGSPDWPQLLRTIYQIRCNLFHGAKSPENLRDRELVGHADIVLRQFIEGSGCFDWHD